MPITQSQLKAEIHLAKFPFNKRQFVYGVISEGLKGFREYSTRRYRRHTGKLIKKPQSHHTALIGRYSQAQARAVLFTALCRAWRRGMGTEPTLNNREDPDSPFFRFAQQVLVHEGVGDIHAHLEQYWSDRKKTVLNNDKNLADEAFL